jgi:putative ABC transport system permease protein
LSAQLGWNTDQYNGTDYSVYVLTKKGTDIRAFNTKIAQTYKMPINNIENLAIALVPIKTIHLNANIGENTRANLIALLVGGVIALLLSCFNYINLSTILFSARTKEVGINKTVGAGKLAIFRQFMTDTFLAALISFGMAILFIALILPSFDNLFDIKIDIVPNLKIISIVVSVFILTVLFSGFYPALLLSGFKPISLIRSNIDSKRGKNNLMGILITLQFVVAVMLIQFLLITSKQASHLSEYNVTGFDGNEVLVIDGNAWGDLKRVKNNLLENPNVEAVSWGSRIPGVGMGLTSSWKQEDNKEMALHFRMESDYLKTFKVRLLEGRTFSEKIPDENRQEVIINKLTANSLGLNDPIGRKMILNGKQYDIIGLVDDFQAVPPIFADLPIIIVQSGNTDEHLLVRINPKNHIETQKFIHELLSKINSEFPVEMQFYGDFMAEQAKSFYTTGTLINVFTGIIIFNAMMGLFGLSFFVSQNKNKEIGIRKVHGAAVFDIVWKFGKGFVTKLLLAFCIASPLIYIGAQKYLSIFPRHIKLGPGILMTGGLIALFILIISSGFKLLQAANGNPVKTLRYE